jgi:UDP-N-acetylmuramoyl-L-alanyl-D-glutamate--2,6-diaminopimelate ligase
MSLHALLKSAGMSQLTPQTRDVAISAVVADNRRVVPGALFVAHKGLTNDAHRFIPDALARGAAAIVCEQPQLQLTDSVPVVVVTSARAALGPLSAAWHGHPSRTMRVIGITGTDGKTTTANLLYGILRAAGHTTGLISTINAMIGAAPLDTGLHVSTPNADDLQRYLAQMRDAGVTHCVIETTSHGLALNRVDGVDYDVAVITNITHEHLDLHGTREAYRAAKARLFEMAPVHVLNADDDYSFELLSQLPHQRQLRYTRGPASDTAHADWQLSVSSVDLGAGRIDAAAQRTDATLALPLHTQLLGDFNVANCLAAAGAALALDVPVDAIVTGIASVTGVAGRMQRIDAGQPYLAVVDFAHTPNSLESCLRTLRALTPGKLIVAFGCAGARDVQKRPLMGGVASRYANIVILTAEDPRSESFTDICDQIEAGMWDADYDLRRIEDRGEALRVACALAGPGDTVVACGKGHEQSLCFGKTEFAWDDRDALRAAIGGRALPLGPALA